MILFCMVGKTNWQAIGIAAVLELRVPKQIAYRRYTNTPRDAEMLIEQDGKVDHLVVSWFNRGASVPLARLALRKRIPVAIVTLYDSEVNEVDEYLRPYVVSSSMHYADFVQRMLELLGMVPDEKQLSLF